MTLHEVSGMMFLPDIIRRLAMERFIDRHRDRVIGTLSGFDRMLFRGSLRSISYMDGMNVFLACQRVRLCDFGRFAERLSKQIMDHAQEIARRNGQEIQHLRSPKISKEEVARRIMKEKDIRQGLICVLSCVEPCQTFQFARHARSGAPCLEPAQRKCLHLYFYYLDREFGFMHVRLQTWLPFPIQVCMNGREYLARCMDKAGIGYERRENCFPRIDDLPRAQAWLDRLGQRSWQGFLNALARRVNAVIHPNAGLDLQGYYWTMRASEYATDVMFRDGVGREAIYHV